MRSLAREFLLPPNLLSLSRIPLGFGVFYVLSMPDDTGTLLALFLCLVASATDWLDGYLARRSSAITQLGLLLDPLADKLFAAIVCVAAILYREFPVWLACVIVGRDLLILLAAGALRKQVSVSVPSNLTGKYTFAALLILLISAIIRYPFGMSLLSIVSLVLILLSIIEYARIYQFVQRNGKLPIESDATSKKRARLILTWSISIVYVAGLILAISRGELTWL